MRQDRQLVLDEGSLECGGPRPVFEELRSRSLLATLLQQSSKPVQGALGTSRFPRLRALDGADRVLIVQSSGALQAKRFHRQKLHLVLVAMRHFACELERRGLGVDHVRAESLASGLRRHVRYHRPERALPMAPNSAAGRVTLAKLPRVQLLPDAMFFTDPEEFSRWVAPRGRLVMEDFYRVQRRRLELLMDGDQPVGGRWNFRRRDQPP